MRICDTCRKQIPLRNRDYIEISAYGKYGDFLIKIHGDRHLTFCSLTCLLDLNFDNKPKEEPKFVKCYLDKRRKCYHPEDHVFCQGQVMICDEMKPYRGDLHELLVDARKRNL